MKRHYAEALKYCRLILQYEPHNATARGFFPLLQHKLGRNRRSDNTTACGATPPSAGEPHPHPQVSTAATSTIGHSRHILVMNDEGYAEKS